jgi:hypothetical protein
MRGGGGGGWLGLWRGSDLLETKRPGIYIKCKDAVTPKMPPD